MFGQYTLPATSWYECMGVMDVGATSIRVLRQCHSDMANVRWLSAHLHALTYGRRLLCLHGAHFPWGSRPRM